MHGIQLHVAFFAVCVIPSCLSNRFEVIATAIADHNELHLWKTLKVLMYNFS